MDLSQATAAVSEFDKCRVKHPKREFVFKRLNIMSAYATNFQQEKQNPDYDPYAEKSEKKGMIVSGFPGVGKSSLCGRYVQLNKPYMRSTEQGDQLIVHTLYFQLPGQVTVKRIIAGLLRALGYAPNTSKDEDTLTADLLSALTKCEVKIIILDEIQHLSSRKNVDHMPLIQNSLKGLINDCDQFFVFVGDLTTPKIIKGCGQLGRRAPTTVTLEPFSFPATEQSETFAVVKSLLAVMPDKTGVSLSRKVDLLEFSQRLFIASGGVIDTMRFYMSEALLDALISGQRSIDLSHFSDAFLLAPSDNALMKANPFAMTRSQLTKWIDKAVGYAS
ncbi:MAG: hypothetical protein CMN84_10035 [Spongiibacteraceae bacterium]|jgi:hypothetical protein|nr:hypothetical protein [Spongiibacteraceae bacterium]